MAFVTPGETCHGPPSTEYLISRTPDGPTSVAVSATVAAAPVHHPLTWTQVLFDRV